MKCVAYSLHNCALDVRTNRPNINELIIRIKLATVKIFSRPSLFAEIGYLPDVIIKQGCEVH